jgi:hypothetical protein
LVSIATPPLVAAHDERRKMPRLLKITGVVAGAWLALYGLGGGVARYYAPDFGKPAAVKAHIARHIRYRAQPRPVQGRPAIDIGIGVVCGEKVYGWNPRAGTPFVDDGPGAGRTHDEPSPPRINDVGLDAFIAGLGAPETRPLPRTLRKLADLDGRQRRGALVTLAGGLTGFAPGFWHGYRSAPDCDSRAFKDVVGDNAFWRELADCLPLTKGIGG